MERIKSEGWVFSERDNCLHKTFQRVSPRQTLNAVNSLFMNAPRIEQTNFEIVMKNFSFEVAVSMDNVPEQIFFFCQALKNA